MPAAAGFTARPPSNIKQYKKWKKEVYQRIESSLNGMGKSIEEISPFYDVKTGKIKGQDMLNLFDQESKSYQNLRNHMPKSIEYALTQQHKKVYEVVRALIVYDTAISSYGMKDEKVIESREEMMEKISSLLLSFAPSTKYRMIEKICEMDVLSRISETRLCWDAYYDNNDMRNVYTYEIAKLLMSRTDNDVINQVLEYEITKIRTHNEQTIRNEMALKDALLLQEYLNKGEPFYAYRGFAVDQDEYVREGRKADGEAYYKWKSGKGLSFTFDKDCALFFCYWQLFFMELYGELRIDSPWALIPDTIRTKDEWVNHWTYKITNIIDKSGKKPIVGRFLVDPNTIAMLNVAKNEQEINVAPENVVLVDYEIVSSRKIAEAMWERRYASLGKGTDMVESIDKSKVSTLTTVDDEGKLVTWFAETDDIREEIKKCKEEFLTTQDFSKFYTRIQEVFIEHAVEIPNDLHPAQKATRKFVDFITRNEERLVRKRGRAYISKE